MKRRNARTIALLALCVVGGTAADIGTVIAAEDTPVAARKLVAALRDKGRAEVDFTRRHQDLLRDREVELHGRLVLEPPHLAKLEFDETKEQISLRHDGGEWLQPQLEQMLRFEPERAWAALRWWRLFAGSNVDGWTERKTVDERYVVRMGLQMGLADSAEVRIGEDGLPEEIRILEVGDMSVVYTMGRWRFLPARGEDDFVLEAPDGYEVFDMP